MKVGDLVLAAPTRWGYKHRNFYRERPAVVVEVTSGLRRFGSAARRIKVLFAGSKVPAWEWESDLRYARIADES